MGDLIRIIYSGLVRLFFGSCLHKKSSIINEKKDSSDDFFDSSYVKNEDSLSSKDKIHYNELTKPKPRLYPVPLAIIFLILAGYISLGSIIFRDLEGWSQISSTYFSFITIATIGLGDLVPGFYFSFANY